MNVIDPMLRTIHMRAQVPSDWNLGKENIYIYIHIYTYVYTHMYTWQRMKNIGLVTGLGGHFATKVCN